MESTPRLSFIAGGFDSVILGEIQNGPLQSLNQRTTNIKSSFMACNFSGKRLVITQLLVTLLAHCVWPHTGLMAQLSNVRLSTLDGQQFKGTVETIDAQGNLAGDGLPKGLQLSEVVRIDLPGRARPTTSTREIWLQLVNGSTVAVKALGLKGETLEFESAIGLDSLPLQVVRAIIWRESAQVKQQLEQPLASQDRVIVETADGERVVQGLVEGLNAQQLLFQYQNETRKISVGRINAVLTADIGGKPMKGSMATVDMSDGSIVKGLIKELKDKRLSLQISDGVLLSLATDQVVSISILSDRQLYLSDVEPIEVQQKTEFTIQRGWQRDKSVEGNVLTLPVGALMELKEFRKGLGSQAFTQLDFSNENQFTVFKATVGIDAETRGKGDCQMAVRGDGIEIWSARVKATDAAQEIELDIAGIKVVSLFVYPGEGFDLADHADWCNARFEK
jgi:hypothetical protein